MTEHEGESDTITLSVGVRLTAAQVAEAFWSMSSDAQAAFFIHLGHLSDEASPAALDIQLSWMAEALQNHADRRGIATLCKLGDYAYKFGRLDQKAEAWML